jgi:GTP-binding protein EngB required for normal cell division
MDHAAKVLDGLTRVVGELRLQSLEPQLAACRDRLRAGTRVEVAVLGRFKAGKSSFLNHLDGRAVLPSRSYR